MARRQTDRKALASRLRSFFPNFMPTDMNSSMDGGYNEGQGLKLSTECPISHKPIINPVRGSQCNHLQCFDLESYLFLNLERSLWRCPICFAATIVETIEVDEFVGKIIKNAESFGSSKVIFRIHSWWFFLVFVSRRVELRNIIDINVNFSSMRLYLFTLVKKLPNRHLILCPST